MRAPRTAAGAVAFALILGGAGCSSDDDGDATDDTTADANSSTTSAGSDPDGSELPSLDDLSAYDTLQDIADELDAVGIVCELEYEGLEDDDKIVSLCTIEGGQATLTIWKDPDGVAELVGADAATELTVYGQNWTIDLRDAAVATTVAEALGGATG